MKFNKAFKPIECTRTEFNTVRVLIEDCSCLNSAVSIVRTYLIRGLIEWKLDIRRITTSQIEEMAFFTVQAVRNNYKYLKVID